MNKSIQALLVLIASLTISCASTHPGLKATKVTSNSDLKLTISANVVNEYSDSAHQFIDFTFENPTTSWERIDSIEFQYGNEESLIYNVIVGQDLITWANSLKERKAIEDHNDVMALTGLAIAGGLLSGISRDENLKAAGSLAYGAGVGGIVYKGFKESLRGVNVSKLVPDEHLMNGNFSVPAKMFVRKWILLNVPGDRWATMIHLTINTIDGRSETYQIPVN